MTRAEIIAALKANFDIKELVCPHTYARFGDNSWQFLQTPLLHTLLVLRTKILNVPLNCNNWYKVGGKLSQHGLRCNLCEEVKKYTDINRTYLSAHIQGLAVDLTSPKMKAQQMRDIIKDHADDLPYPVRIEQNDGDNPTWLHIDCYDTAKGNKITPFKG